MLLLLSHGGNRTTDLWCALGKQAVTTVGKGTSEASRPDRCSKRARAEQQVGTAACNSSLGAPCCPGRHGLPVPAERGRQQEPCSCLSRRQDDPEQLFRAGSSTKMTQGTCVRPGGSLRAHTGTPNVSSLPNAAVLASSTLNSRQLATRLGFSQALKQRRRCTSDEIPHLFKTLLGSGRRCGVCFV